MNIPERKRNLAALRRDLNALSSRISEQQSSAMALIGRFDNLHLGLNLHHSYEASLARQRHAQRLGFAAEVEAEWVEQLMLRAAAESLRTSGSGLTAE